MKRRFLILSELLVVMAISLSGCESEPRYIQTIDPNPNEFHIEKIHIHPSFTALRRSNNDLAYPDQIDVFVELLDQFNDPIKSTGKFRFEFNAASSKPSANRRGERLSSSLVDLTHLEDNQAKWDKTTRCYQFTLEMPGLPEKAKQFELVVTFMRGYRLEDKLILDYTAK
jgi:hypothetical protein